MKKTVTYTVIITRHPKGFVASCPAFQDCLVLGNSRSNAYRSIKQLIRKRLIQAVETDTSPPTNPVVSVKHLRLNLLEIEKEVRLE
jgi:predicted RNase H-like HicB family nuclease